MGCIIRAACGALDKSRLRDLSVPIADGMLTTGQSVVPIGYLAPVTARLACQLVTTTMGEASAVSTGTDTRKR